MKKIRIFAIAIAALAATVAKAQKVTFYSAEFEEGVKTHVGLGESDDVFQSQTDTITRIDLSGLGITDIRDVVYLPNVKELNLSYNDIEDVADLIGLDSLRVLDISNNQLESVNMLAFTHADSMTVDVSNNYITDFTLFFRPIDCQFTLLGMGLQKDNDPSYFEVLQLYAYVDKTGAQTLTYRCYTNMEEAAYVECGSMRETALVDGTINKVNLPKNLSTATKVVFANGKKADSTWVVPVSNYDVAAGQTIVIPTGLPENYHIGNVSAELGNVEAEGTVLTYTAPEQKVSDVVSFSYYEGSRLRGYGQLLTGLLKGDANDDGRVTVTDIGVVANWILNKPTPKFNEKGADANGDGRVTVTDIGTIVDIILKQNH